MKGLVGLTFVLLAACGPGTRGDDGDDGDDGNGTPDASTGPFADAPVGPGSTVVYAHTSSTLYSVDPDTLAITLIAPFGWSSGADQMTDIAVDQSGQMIGMSFTSVYRVDPVTAAATRLSAGLAGLFNGLSFVPATAVGGTATDPDVLVAIRNADGMVFRVDPATGGTTPIGNMGAFASSGDLVSVVGFGTAATADGGLGADRLVRLADSTFAATPVGTTTGYLDIWGVAFWGNRIYGFTAGGDFVLIDPTTGAASLVQGGGPAWWGAAVTTRAVVIE